MEEIMFKLKKIMIAFLASLVLFTVVPTVLPNTNVETVEAATIKTNKIKATINVGEELKLKISGTTKKIKWISSNKKVATVNTKGVVTPIKAGKVTITATVSGKICKCSVTVKEELVDATTSATSK